MVKKCAATSDISNTLSRMSGADDHLSREGETASFDSLDAREEPGLTEHPSRGDSPRPVLVLGLGNDILSDDAIGLHVVQEVRRQLAGIEGVEVRECSEMGLSLLDYLVGYRYVVLVDAVQTRKYPPGHLHEIDAESLKILPEISPHFLGLGEVLALGHVLCLPMPLRVKILAVEVGDPFTISTHLTPAVSAAAPAAIHRVMTLARECLQEALREADGH